MIDTYLRTTIPFLLLSLSYFPNNLLHPSYLSHPLYPSKLFHIVISYF